MRKHIVITGVTRGLGRAMMHGFIDAGHQVSGCGRDQSAIYALQKAHPDHSFTPLDVTDTEAVMNWANRIAPPDLLLNNAAIMNRPAPLWHIHPDEFAQLTHININGVHNIVYAFVPRMITNGSGVIINFSSGWGRSTSSEVAPYCASKWAIEGLTQAMSQELPAGLGVVALNPGIINTDMLQRCWGDGASTFPCAKTWARSAIPFILGITDQDNGRALTCP